MFIAANRQGNGKDLDSQHVADAIVYMANLPLDANVPFLTVMATKMPLFGRG